jgi:hypothetical protein
MCATSLPHATATMFCCENCGASATSLIPEPSSPAFAQSVEPQKVKWTVLRSTYLLWLIFTINTSIQQLYKGI